MTTFADAWRRVPTGSRVFIAGCTGEPTRALDALRRDPELAAECRFTGVWIPGVNRHDPSEAVPGGSADAFFVTPALRDGFRAGRVRFRPLSYSAIVAWLGRQAAEMTAFVQVAPPQRGEVSLGPAADFTPSLVEGGARLIGEVNPNLPSPRGGVSVPVARFDVLIDAPSDPITHDSGAVDRTVDALSETVAGLIGEGDVIQLGIGKVQASVLPKLADHRGLGFHGGMMSAPAWNALAAGAFAKGVTTGVALGSAAFYRRIADRRDVRFKPASYTHNAAVLARLERFVSVASALEVDLFGQVNAEMADGRQISGHGGIAEFARGAIASPGGRSIIALPSTARRGAVSRIVPRLASGAICSIARGDVDCVVTEYGLAQLRGSDIDARAEALISVAHPDFQAGLSNDWEAMRRAM